MQAVLSHPKVLIINPQGNLNAAIVLEFERNVIAALEQQDVQALIVNLKAVESLDSAGLMALVSVLKISQAQEKRFHLCSVSPSLRIIFELTQLDKVFEMLA